MSEQDILFFMRLKGAEVCNGYWSQRRLQLVLGTVMLADSLADVQTSSQGIQTYDFASKCPDPEEE